MKKALLCLAVLSLSSAALADSEIQITTGGRVQVQAGEKITVSCVPDPNATVIGTACRCVPYGVMWVIEKTNYLSNGTKNVTKDTSANYARDYCESVLRRVTDCGLYP